MRYALVYSLIHLIEEFDLMEPLTLLTLDIISRCAFGFSIEAQTASEKSYAQAILVASKEMLYHLYWIFIPDFLWNLTPSDARFKKVIFLFFFLFQFNKQS
jgi:hypothetical protein